MERSKFDNNMDEEFKLDDDKDNLPMCVSELDPLKGVKLTSNNLLSVTPEDTKVSKFTYQKMSTVKESIQTREESKLYPNMIKVSRLD